MANGHVLNLNHNDQRTMLIFRVGNTALWVHIMERNSLTNLTSQDIRNVYRRTSFIETHRILYTQDFRLARFCPHKAFVPEIHVFRFTTIFMYIGFETMSFYHMIMHYSIIH